jgi:cbb3-type cytochrome oxidase maturation protein
MSILYLLLPLMLAITIGALIAFVWATGDAQLDDLDTPPLRILSDDD